MTGPLHRRALGSATLAVLALAAAPAVAQTWSPVSTYTVSGGPVAAGAAGSSPGGGWRDIHGGVWSITAANQLQSTPLAAPWSTGELARPASEAEVDQEVAVTVTPNAIGGDGTAVYTYGRWTNAGASGSGYAVGVDFESRTIQAFAVVGGALTQIGVSVAIPTPTAGASYGFTTTVVQTNATTTTLTATLQDSSGDTLATASWTDATAALQNVSSPPAVFSFYDGGGTSIGLTRLATYTDVAAPAPTTVIPVNSAAFKFSPATWKGDTGRGGALYRQSWNDGAWVTVAWTASASPSATLLLPTSSTSSRLSYLLNGVLTDNVTATGNVILSGLAPGAANTLTVYLRNSTQSARWGQGSGGGNTVQVDGLQVDTGSSAGVAPAARPWVLIVGDSITEGTEANLGADDQLDDYSFLVGQALEQAGYDYAVSACGYSGWLRPGDSTGDVPAYYAVSGGVYSEAASRWDKLDAGVSLLDGAGQLSAYGQTGTAPAAILINYMTNEALQGSSTSDAALSVTGAITALRAAAPSAKILILTPFGLDYPAKYAPAYAAALRQGVATYQSAHPSDAGVKLIDLGAGLAVTLEASGLIYVNSDAVHPTAAGHALVAPMVAAQVISALSGGGGGAPSVVTVAAKFLTHH